MWACGRQSYEGSLGWCAVTTWSAEVGLWPARDDVGGLGSGDMLVTPGGVGGPERVLGGLERVVVGVEVVVGPV